MDQFELGLYLVYLSQSTLPKKLNQKQKQEKGQIVRKDLESTYSAVNVRLKTSKMSIVLNIILNSLKI